MNNKKIITICTAIATLIAVSYLPEESQLMSREAWKFCGCFLFFIICLVGKVVAEYVVTLSTMGLITAMNVCPFNDITSEFASPTVWLCIAVFIMGIGISNSGIGKRISLYILTLFPKSYRGAMTAMLVSGLATTPVIPSAMAKTAVMAPVIGEICKSLKFAPDSRKAFGIWFPSFMCTCQLGMAFITGSTNTAIMLGFIGKTFSWITWFKMTLIWFLVSILLTYIFCRVYCCKEDDEDLQEIYKKIEEQAKAKISRTELTGLIIITVSLLMWITQPMHGIPAHIVAFLAIAAFSFFDMISVSEMCSKGMWNTIIFVGGMLGFSKQIQALGIGDWIAWKLSAVLGVIMNSPFLFVGGICIIVYLARYVLAAPMCGAAVFIALLTPLVSIYGISQFVMVFVVWTASCCWNAPYTNPAYTALINLTNGAIDGNNARKGSYVYCIINIAALLASVPYWKYLMLC